ncbi:MAG TPA: DUF1501 domain-containing protein [Phycisphaerales bacterium]|nr:DUF1501 domain-containing protein [Phycisphaerales bacterium]
MNPLRERELLLTRRQLFGRAATGIGAAALASLLNPALAMASGAGGTGGPLMPHFAPKAKRVIYLFMSGAPSQIDLFDYKPKMGEMHGQDLPDSVRMGQRITGMTSGQSRLQLLGSPFKFAQHGKSGVWLSELLPHTARIVDDITLIKSVHTEAINHDPAITYITTGSQQPGRPSLGAWLSYGLGSENSDLPAFIVFISIGSGNPNDQPLFDRLWASGFLPSSHQGVKFRGSGDRVLYLSDPPGVSRSSRRSMLDAVAKLNRITLDKFADQEVNTRIQQYEMAYRMQTSVPELTNFQDEPESTFDLYGPESRKPGSFANNCIMARRLAERGVRFIQLFHRGWDQHGNLRNAIKAQCNDTDQPSAALVMDLKQRGLLDDTLVIWGGEFGRTVYCQGNPDDPNSGRDHHGRNFCVWLAGGGIKPGMVYGSTDEFCYNIAEKPVHIHDLNATVLHCLGLNHERLTFPYQGRDFRLTDVAGKVVHDILV